MGNGQQRMALGFLAKEENDLVATRSPNEKNKIN